MTDLASVEPTTFTPPPSTVLNPDTAPGPSGGGAPRTLSDPEAKEPSLRDMIAQEVKADAEPEEPDAKDAKETKDAQSEEKAAKERAPDGKFAAKPKDGEAEAEGAEGQAAKPVVAPERPATRNGVSPDEAPTKFQADSKEVWGNVPRSVKRDIDVMLREHEVEVAKHTEATQRYEQLREFDDIAKANGRDLRESLAKVAEIEDALHRNPLAGIQRLLIEAGPRKADGTPLSLMEVAQYVVQAGPEAYQRTMQAPKQQPQQQADPRVEQLEKQVHQMQVQQLTQSVIEPFSAAHPRYNELEGDIAFFLGSGKIPASLSLSDKLAVAYDMAERINPSSHVVTASAEVPASPGRVAEDLDGTKSIKSAPGAVSPDMEPERGGSIRDTVVDELRRFSRSRG